jgi:hypothetical protein
MCVVGATPPSPLATLTEMQEGNSVRGRTVMRITRGDFGDSRVVDLLRIHLTKARAETAPGSAHALDVCGLQSPDIYLGILKTHLAGRSFVAAGKPTVADVSMVGYLLFPKNESGYDLAATHPAVHAWLTRVAALPGWRAPYICCRENACSATCKSE